MPKKKTAMAGRTWTFVRLALYWARKGGIFRRRLMTDLLPNYLKSLRATTHNSISYGEREFSFDETPMFRFKMHRPASMRFRNLPHIPCINPSVDFDINDDDGGAYDRNGDNSFCRNDVHEDYECGSSGNCQGDEGIVTKAEEFIARFYEQMKLQRQVSYLQYSEMLQRGTS